MNYCPDCGAPVKFERTENDVATMHTHYGCSGCGAGWLETISKEDDGTLHISPVKGGD